MASGDGLWGDISRAWPVLSQGWILGVLIKSRGPHVCSEPQTVANGTPGDFQGQATAGIQCSQPQSSVLCREEGQARSGQAGGTSEVSGRGASTGWTAVFSPVSLIPPRGDFPPHGVCPSSRATGSQTVASHHYVSGSAPHLSDQSPALPEEEETRDRALTEVSKCCVPQDHHGGLGSEGCMDFARTGESLWGCGLC